MKTIVTVLGARPQFIKASVVSHALRADGRLREARTGRLDAADLQRVLAAV